VKCRRVRDIEIPELEQVLQGRAAIGDFKVLGSSLEVQALCSECIGKRPRRAKPASSAAPKSA
jgi:Fe2+ or Zn2+ uptake regulation protein